MAKGRRRPRWRSRAQSLPIGATRFRQPNRAVTDLGGGQFIGDYLGMAMTGNRVWPVYLSTEFGTPGLFSHEISSVWPIFTDGFETGDTSEWSAIGP